MGIALDLIVGDDVKLLTDSAVLSLGVGSDATLTHDGTTGLTIAANPITVDSGDALTLDAHTGIHIFKDAGTEVLRFTEGNSGDVTIKLATNGKDLIFTDNGDATGLKVLMQPLASTCLARSRRLRSPIPTATMPSLLPTAAVSRPPARLSQAVQLHSLASSARRQGRLAVATVLRVRRSLPQASYRPMGPLQAMEL